MLEKQIQELTEEVCSYHLRKVNALLSICESPIEQLYLLKLLQFYFGNNLDTYSTSFLYEPTMIDDYGRFFSNHPKEKYNLPRVSELNKTAPYIYGVHVQYNYVELSFDIIPQYEIRIGMEKHYRVDFAIKGNGYHNKATKKEVDFNILIECDGYEYHKTPELINRDNIRANNLKSHGWVEFRYSGRLINDTKFSAAKDIESFIWNIIRPGDEMWDKSAELAD